MPALASSELSLLGDVKHHRGSISQSLRRYDQNYSSILSGLSNLLLGSCISCTSSVVVKYVSLSRITSVDPLAFRLDIYGQICSGEWAREFARMEPYCPLEGFSSSICIFHFSCCLPNLIFAHHVVGRETISRASRLLLQKTKRRYLWKGRNNGWKEYFYYYYHGT